MPSECPGEVKIGPFWYKIVFSKETVVNPRDPSLNVAGFCSQEKQQIIISSTAGMSDGYVRGTLWHEIKHAVMDLVSDDDARTIAYSEEEVISRMANLELGVMVDNPQLMKYLIHESGGSKRAR